MSQDSYFVKESNHWKLAFLKILAVALLVLLTLVCIWRRFTIGGYTLTDGALFTIIAAHVGLYFLARKGWIRTASYLVIITTFLSISLMVYNGKGIYDSAVISYVALLIITYMLLEWRYSLIVLIASLAWLWILGTLTYNNTLQYTNIDPIYIYLRDLTVVFILVSTLAHFYLRRLNSYIARLASELNERKKAEETIRKQEENYRMLFEQASEGILITSSEGLIQMANESMEHLSGYTHHELIDRPLNFLFATPEEFRYPANICQKGSQRAFVKTTILLGKNLKKVPIELRSRQLPDGRMQIFFTNIEKRLQAEKSLKDFERIFKLSANPICMVNQAGNFLKVNPALERLLEYSEVELLQNNILELIHPEDKERAMESLGKQFAAKANLIEEEIRYQTKNGSEVWISWVGQPMYKEDIGFLIGHDSTEKRHFEEELIRAKERAEESDRLKTAFLENMSHEIRTPMNGIIGFSNMLLSENITEEEKERFCKIIINSGQNLLTIVNDILDISRIETGLVEIEHHEVNLPDLCQTLKEFYQPKVTNLNLKLYFEPPTLPCTIILTDRNRLYQVLNNLISNALKFTREGEIRMGCQIKDQELEFYVSDTGIGISQEIQQLIFERFRQAELEISKQFGGTGLGLSISQKLIQLMGGRIWVESAPGAGSTFRFTIPYRPVKTKTTPGNSIQPDKKNRSGIILVAEDDFANYEYLEVVLSKAGFTVLHVEDGESAVQTMKDRQDIDLILMDIKLPKLNGYDATRSIKKLHPEVPIIAQTAYAMIRDSKKALEAGCDDYLSKPLVKRELLEKIDKHLN